MKVSIRRKVVLLLVLFAILATPWASAAGRQGASVQPVQVVEPATVELFSSIWSFVRRVSSKEGCHIDPWGRCTPKNPPPQTKECCHIDPNGRCIG
jgi:hypothetical protein